MNLPEGARRPTSSTEPPKLKMMLALLIAVAALGPGFLNVLIPSVPRLATTLQVSLATAQLTISLFLLGLATSQIVAGPLSDRFGRRPVMLAGLTVASVSSLAVFLMPFLQVLIVARWMQAVGVAAGTVVSYAIIRDVFDRNRAAAIIALVTSGMMLSPMIAPLVGGLIDSWLGWEAIFLLLAVLGSTVLISVYVGLPETLPADARRKGGFQVTAIVGSLVVDRRFLAYLGCAAFVSGPHFVFLSSAPHFIIVTLGRSSAEYGLWSAAVSSAYLAGNLLSAMLAVKVGVDAMIRYGVVVTVMGPIAGILLFAFAPSAGPLAVVIPQMISNVGNGLVLPSAIAGALSVRPQVAGTASGFVGCTTMGTGAVIVQLVSFMTSETRTPLHIPLAGLFICMLMLVSYWLLARSRADADHQT